MKKIPLVLSGLVLTASGANLTTAVLATSSNQTGNSIGVIPSTLDAGIAEMALVGTDGYIRIDHTTFNPYEHYRQILVQQVGIHDNSITLRFDDAFNGWKPRQVVLIYRDYENGVTEAEADDKLKELTEEQHSWGIELLNRDMNGAAMTWNASLNREHPVKENLTDIIYYAVKYARETTDESGNKQLTDAYWLRGKVDYRKCGHSKVFDRGSMSCFARVDSDAKVLNYLPYDTGNNFLELPENEIITPWEDELSTLLSEKANKINTELNTLLSNLIRVKTIMSDAETDIAKIKKSAPSSSDAETWLRQAEGLKSLLERTQGIYNGIAGSGDIVCPTESEIKRLERELAEVEGELRVAQARIISIEARAAAAESKQADAEAKLAETEGQLAAARITITENEQKIQESEKEMQESRRKLLETEAKLAEVEAECQKLQTKVQELTLEMGKMKQENTQLRQENAKLQQENQKLADAKADFGQQNEKLEAENDALRQKNREFEAKTAELEAKMAELEREKMKNEEEQENMPSEAPGGSLSGSENNSAVIQPDHPKDGGSGINSSQGTGKQPQEAVNSPEITVSTQEKENTAVNSGETGVSTTDRVRVNESTDAAPTEISAATSAESDDKVEVPNLGETGVEHNFWWLLIGVVGALGVGLMWVRRAFLSKIRR